MKDIKLLHGRVDGEENYLLFDRESYTMIILTAILYGLLDNKDRSEFPGMLADHDINLDSFLQIEDEINLVIKERRAHHSLSNCDPELFSVLSNLRLNISGRCNLICSYCYANQGRYNAVQGYDMSRRTMENAIGKLTDLYGRIEKIAFFGGEPLLNAPIIDEAIKFSTELGSGRTPRFSMDTNGTLYPRIERLLDVETFVSIDGMKRYHDLYRITRSGKPTYDIIKENLHRIGENNPGFRYGIQCTITPAMIRDGIHFSEIYENLLRDFSPFTISLNPVFGCFPGEMDILQVYRQNIDDLFSSKITGCFCGDQSILQWIYMLIRGLSTEYICPAGFTSLTISFNGDIYPCHLLMQERFRMGNVNRNSAKEIEEQVLKFLDTAGRIFRHQEQKCFDCWFRDFCIGCMPKIDFSSDKSHDFCHRMEQVFSYLLLKISSLKRKPGCWQSFLRKLEERES